jgi:hypothetical protein
VKRAESVDGSPPITRPNLDAIVRALEAAGVEFIPENGGGAGVRLRKGGGSHATPADHPEARADGPDDEDRAGPEAPDDA